MIVRSAVATNICPAFLFSRFGQRLAFLLLAHAPGTKQPSGVILLVRVTAATHLLFPPLPWPRQWLSPPPEEDAILRRALLPLARAPVAKQSHGAVLLACATATSAFRPALFSVWRWNLPPP